MEGGSAHRPAFQGGASAGPEPGTRRCVAVFRDRAPGGGQRRGRAGVGSVAPVGWKDVRARGVRGAGAWEEGSRDFPPSRKRRFGFEDGYAKRSLTKGDATQEWVVNR